MVQIRYAMLATFLLSGNLYAVAPGPVTDLQPLALDSTGHPSLQWTRVSGATQYVIERRSDNYADGETLCYGDETLVDGWCRFSVAAGSGSGPFVFADPNIRIDSSNPAEYRYRVAAADAEDNASAFNSRWANSCPVAVEDPEQGWLDSVVDYNGTELVTAGDIAPTTTPTVKGLPTVNPNYYVLSDDRYIAVFGKSGGLVSLTHRNYGKDYVAGYRTAGHALYKGYWADAWTLTTVDNSAANGVPGTLSSGKIGLAVPAAVPVTGGIQFTWSNPDSSGYDIVTTWTLASGGSSGLHAKASVTPVGSPGPSAGLSKFDFPVIRGLGYEHADLLWPRNIGAKQDEFPYKDGATLYDTSRARSWEFMKDGSMQFFGFSYPIDSANGNLLYVGAEDSALLPKGFTIQMNFVSGSETVPAAFSAWNYPINGTGLSVSKIDSSTHDYDLVLQPMCGDFTKIAKRYRKFAEQQDWLKVSEDKTLVEGDSETFVTAKTAARIDIPQKLKDSVFWWTQNNGLDKTLDLMKDYANGTISYTAIGLKAAIGPTQGVDVGIHLNNWYQPGFDRNMPEFTERVGGPTDLAGYMAAVQDDGTLVMAYINSTNVDVNDRYNSSYECTENTGTIVTPGDGYTLILGDQTCGWWNRYYVVGSTSYSIQDNAMYRANGASKTAALETEIAGGSGATAAVAQPGSTFWRSVHDANVETVFSSGADGVYLDTFGSGYRADYAALWGVSVGHPLGHNAEWREDTSALASSARIIGELRDVVAETPNKRFIAAEHFNEAFIRDVDLFTVYSDHDIYSFPLAQLVYSDYQLFAGPQGRINDTDAARRLRYGRAFTWGFELGLSSLHQVCGSDGECSSDELRDVVSYFRTLAKARKELADFLSLGEFLGIPAATEPTMVSTDWCVDQGCTVVEEANMPAIQIGRWLSVDRKRAFIATNTSTSAATTTIAIPPNWRGETPACFDETRTSASSCVAVDGDNLDITLGALSVRYIEMGDEPPGC